MSKVYHFRLQSSTSHWLSATVYHLTRIYAFRNLSSSPQKHTNDSGNQSVLYSSNIFHFSEVRGTVRHSQSMQMGHLTIVCLWPVFETLSFSSDVEILGMMHGRYKEPTPTKASFKVPSLTFHTNSVATLSTRAENYLILSEGFHFSLFHFFSSMLKGLELVGLMKLSGKWLRTYSTALFCGSEQEP